MSLRIIIIEKFTYLPMNGYKIMIQVSHALSHCMPKITNAEFHRETFTDLKSRF